MTYEGGAAHFSVRQLGRTQCAPTDKSIYETSRFANVTRESHFMGYHPYKKAGRLTGFLFKRNITE